MSVVVPDKYDQLMFIEMIVRSKHLPRIPRDIVWNIWKHYFLVDLVKRFAELMGEKFELSFGIVLTQETEVFQTWIGKNKLDADFFLLLRQRWFIGFFPSFGNFGFQKRCAMNYFPYCYIMNSSGISFRNIAGVFALKETSDPEFKRLFYYTKNIHEGKGNKRLKI